MPIKNKVRMQPGRVVDRERERKYRWRRRHLLVSHAFFFFVSCEFRRTRLSTLPAAAAGGLGVGRRGIEKNYFLEKNEENSVWESERRVRKIMMMMMMIEVSSIVEEIGWWGRIIFQAMFQRRCCEKLLLLLPLLLPCVRSAKLLLSFANRVCREHMKNTGQNILSLEREIYRERERGREKEHHEKNIIHTPSTWLERRALK